MELHHAIQLTKHLLKREGIEGIEVSINKRAKSFLGRARFMTNRITKVSTPHSIELTAWHVLGCSDDKVLNTILHEMAHIIAGREAGHGPAWKDACRRLGMSEKDITRCGDAKDNALAPKHKWHGICPACGVIIKRHKLTKKARTGYHVCAKNKNKDNLMWIEAKHC